MDSNKLSNLLEAIYIPPKRLLKQPAQVPPYHPCLIVQDSQTDVNKRKSCGCLDIYCVKNAPEWIPRAR